MQTPVQMKDVFYKTKWLSVTQTLHLLKLQHLHHNIQR